MDRWDELFPGEDGDAEQDEAAAAGHLRSKGFAQEPEGEEQRDEDAAFVDQRDEGDRAGLHRAIVEDPRERGGRAAQGKEQEITRAVRGQGGERARGSPEEGVEDDESEDDTGAQGEADIGAERFHAALGEDGGEAGEERGEEGLDFPGFHDGLVLRLVERAPAGEESPVCVSVEVYQPSTLNDQLPHPHSRNFRIASRKPGVVSCRAPLNLFAVIIYFLETETAEQEFYSSHLAEHDVRFVLGIEEVGEDAEVLSIFINTRIAVEFLAAHQRLRLIVTRSSGFDHLDLPACRERGIAVANVSDYGFTTIAEHTFALILALSRRLREVMLAPKGGTFSYAATRGFDLAGKTLGIIGMGRIGQRVADLARAFQMTVLAYDIKHPATLERALDFKFVPLEELLSQAHIISLHAPLSPETYHILNRETLAQCREGVVIVNTARGSLIDTQALREALDSGQVGGAGLDVLQDERVMRQSVSHIIAADIIQHLRSDAVAYDARDADRLRELEELMLGDAVLARSNVVFTPHVAFNSVEAVERVRDMTVENILAFAAGEPVNLVT